MTISHIHRISIHADPDGQEVILHQTTADETASVDVLITNPSNNGIELSMKQISDEEEDVIETYIPIGANQRRHRKGIIMNPNSSLETFSWGATYNAQVWVTTLPT